MYQPNDVREQLTKSLVLDLIGPTGAIGDHKETLSQQPSKWYLTGFLVPTESSETQKVDETVTEQLDQSAVPSNGDESGNEEPPVARRSYLPSSCGISFLIAAKSKTLQAIIRWGDYERIDKDKPQSPNHWLRKPREQNVNLKLGSDSIASGIENVPNSGGLQIVWNARALNPHHGEEGVPKGTRSISVFLVNRRVPAGDDFADEAFAFQVELEIHGDVSFVPRPNLATLESDEWDQLVADIQYRDTCEFSVGHAISTEAVVEDGHCVIVRTVWIPSSQVERVAPASIRDVELGMDALSEIADGDDAKTKLGPLVKHYREWIEGQAASLEKLSARRKETCDELLKNARFASKRIEMGIELLRDPRCLEAFRIANRSMANQGRRRLALVLKRPASEIVPEWRPFQLAFILMNLKGIAESTHDDRELVDLLFFPTGGGKTEAYLGLAAFTLVLRRLKNPGITSAGLSVLMRYTLRLLTLDQLGRAAALICALELERQNDVNKLGEWPFEIGLWVGRAATPNRMGAKGDTDRESARAKTIAFKNDDRKPSPIPLEECPWCGEKFRPASFQLVPNPDTPIDLRVCCVNRSCEFSRGNPLPILSVDEPIYRRLPCFIIATVDKFAAMPWTGEVGAFFGRVDRADNDGFYGPCERMKGRALPVDRLLPPDLVIQDELHLISGPLGTMVGLYETALDALSTIEINGKQVRPKIVASTATVRRAESQIQSLFNHSQVDVFPPPGPDRRDSFFAKTHSVQDSNARMYVGIAAQGRSPKVVMLRVYLALLSAAKKAYMEAGGPKNTSNPADSYMTLLGYFNSLRELGGARRLIEDEVRTQLTNRSLRRRVGEASGSFVDRTIAYEAIELTSRITTSKVSEAKRRLEQTFDKDDHVDIAIATNMISVGLDITRLGLMVVFGQPKTSAEYIQATSRVGRDHSRPGLVVTLLNIHKPRDRSHYERKKQRVNLVLENLSDYEVFQEVKVRRGQSLEQRKSVKQAEMETLIASKDELGDDKPDGNFYARCLPSEAWTAPWVEPIERVVLVHRLREVIAQVGFTRFEAISPDIDGELEMGVRRATLAREVTWLPGIENHGEGVFIQFKSKAIEDWLKKESVVRRGESLLSGFETWSEEHHGNKRHFPGLPFVFLHSFAHMLITSVSLECGYRVQFRRRLTHILCDERVKLDGKERKPKLTGQCPRGHGLSNSWRSNQ